MHHDIDARLLILSTVVSFLSAYTGFRLFSLARQRRGTTRLVWVSAAATAHGGGAIWAMHFIAMLSLNIHGIVIRYDVGFTILSLVVAICSVGSGLSAVSILGTRPKVLLASGALMGLGIASMHYLGMSAMTMNASVVYDPVLVVTSIIIAVLASIAALWMVSKLNRERALLTGAVVMAAAVTSMHHVGMAATSFKIAGLPTAELLKQSNVLSANTIAIGVAIITILVLTCAIVAGILDRRADAARKKSAFEVASAFALQERWREMLDDVPLMIWSINADASGSFQNSRWFDFTGDDRDNPQEWLKLVHPDDQRPVITQWQECQLNLEPYYGRFRLMHHSGDYRWVETNGVPQLDDDKNLTGWLGTCLDINARILAETELQASQALTKGLIDASPDCIGVLDVNGSVQFMNEAFKSNELMRGTISALGERWGAMLPSELSKEADYAITAAGNGKTSSLTLFHESPDSGTRWWDTVIAPIRNTDGQVFRLAVIARNITRQKAREAEVRWTASHDTLTGLPSRLLFQDTLASAIAQGAEFCILILDVDHFKQINDTLGHATGDALLVELSERITATIAENDFVARIGGDEFVIILRNLSSPADTKYRAKRIVDRLKTPWTQGGRIFDCSASIGASLFPLHGEDQLALMKNADIALYSAKANHRGAVTFYDPPMRLAMEKRANKLTLARDAINENLISPYYQAIVSMQTGTVVGFEALLRWRHPTRGIQLPCTIAAAFEDSELSVQISDKMIGCVLADIRNWIDHNVDFGYVAINAAAAEFKRGDFAESLLSKMRTASIPPNCIQIEVTETVFLGRGAEYVERALQTLSAHGVKIALDDFGTGYASLSHLRQFPVNSIKIDRSFVQGLPDDENSSAIVDAVISLGRSLDITVVAEGVENIAQEALLSTMGCPLGQGFLYAKALPASRLPRFIRMSNARERIAA